MQLVLAYFYWLRRNLLLKCVSQPRRGKKTSTKTSTYWCSRSSKIIDFGVNRKPVYEFLLVIDSNLGPISLALSRTVSEIWDILAKNRKFFLPLSFSAHTGGNPFQIYGKALRILKLESSGQRWWRLGYSNLHRFWLIHPCDRRTNGRTNGRTDRQTDRIAMAKTIYSSSCFHA